MAAGQPRGSPGRLYRMTLIEQLRQWVRYRRALGQAMEAASVQGYRVPAGEYQRLKTAAREAASRDV